MTFNPAIPTAASIVSQSQAQIQTNFAQSNTVFGIDHVEFDNATSANRGKHNKSTYLDQALAPTTLANEIALYSKSVGGISRLFQRNESNGTEIQISGIDPIVASNGETFLAGNLQIKWGQFTTASTTEVVTYTSLSPALTAFPTNTLMVQLTPINAGGIGNFRVSTANATTFTVVTATGASFYFLAIGY